jgi:hypothetical protein
VNSRAMGYVSLVGACMVRVNIVRAGTKHTTHKSYAKEMRDAYVERRSSHGHCGWKCLPLERR